MANTVNLVTTFLPLVDEKFTTESRKSLLTNNDFDWTGAHSIKVYIIVVTPDTYLLMKQSKDIFLETDVAENMRLRGVIAQLDGAQIIKVPANRLPSDFGFMIAHPVATVAPTKLEDYRVHQDPPGISGDLVEGRICYDAFVLDNKKAAIYYQAVTEG